ncbi:MAG TPA: glycerate kinase, partial [Phycisphaerae bacterium]|nr:glycerate kinase [Phycisphaerae bacterium]
MKIVIAPDSFKESLTAAEVCEAIARGLRAVLPDAVLDKCPMADGGEGTVDALVAATNGTYEHTTVAGPLGEPVTAVWGLLGTMRASAPQADVRAGAPPGKTAPIPPTGPTGEPGQSPTAVLEMAAASGLPLVPVEKRNPLKTTTLGTGQLIRAALDRGVTRIILGIGGSATTDGGAGCVQALGARFLDARGRALPDGACGETLAQIARIDLARFDPRVASTEIVVACDVDNPLCGPRGAAVVYGPQKGATPEIVRQLDEGLAHFADVIARDLGKDVRNIPGAGAAGGLGAGLLAFCGAAIRPGVEIVIDAVRLRERLVGADLLITGEGRLDRQSMMGKLIAGVGRAARDAGVPAVA